ncbi:MAG: metallopeptidase family protein [Alphaproteobacteria bacterium]|nr:metallopeptidase family protein [Alphaproteobacteria bacterium]
MIYSNWSANLPAPSLDDIAEIGSSVLARLPQQFLENITEIIIQVVDFPDEETCNDLDVESPFEILGLYAGVDLSSKSILDQPSGPDVIFLYRRPILDCWCEGDDSLADIITHVLVHEIGHHFGLSDEAMELMEDAALRHPNTLN